MLDLLGEKISQDGIDKIMKRGSKQAQGQFTGCGRGASEFEAAQSNAVLFRYAIRLHHRRNQLSLQQFADGIDT
jgi:hypothetical protein